MACEEVVVVGRRGVEGRAAHMRGMAEKTDAVVAWFGCVERVGDAASGAGKSVAGAVKWWGRVVLRVLVVAWGVWSVCAGEPVGVTGLVELLGALRGGG